MKKVYLACLVFFITYAANAQDIIYSNNFEVGVGDATIVGNGVIVSDPTPGFGRVFHNAAGGQGIRTNFLLLPNNIFANLQASGRRELTIGFWVNRGTASNFIWSPVFSAYGAPPLPAGNTWPMMILQARLIPQVNCFGWSDFTNAQNTTGTNFISTAYLDAGTWQYYTAVFTEFSVRIYINGIVQNAWTLTGDGGGSSVTGLFTNGSALTYICLGGNQAWAWNDPDPAFMFDDIVIYSRALTASDILAKIAAKHGATTVNKIEFTVGELVSEEYFSITGARLGSNFNDLIPGVYIKKSTYSNGEIKVTKIVKKTNSY